LSEYGALLKRRSIRKFKQGKVPDDVVQRILIAGMAAPSAHNFQPWEFILIRDREKLTELSRVCKYWRLLREADFAIAVVANLDGCPPEIDGYFTEDCGACTQNMLIAATGEGIGSCWLGCYPTATNVRGVRDALQIPPAIIPFSLAAFGYAAEEKPAHNEYHAQKVHLEKY
jgi:nitroreductase